MESQSKKLCLLEKTTIQTFAKFHGRDQSDLDRPSTAVTLYKFSNHLPTSKDNSDPTILCLSDFSELTYRRHVFDVEKGAPTTSYCYCSSIIFDTEGDWLVSFTLQLIFPLAFQDDRITIVIKYVETMCSLVKWNDRLVLPIDLDTGTAHPVYSGIEPIIRKKSKAETQGWMEEIAGNIDQVFREGTGERSDTKSYGLATGASFSYELVCSLVRR
ncbi:hypothetical protein FSARC_11917 [Fusarium sarcochroum]|uniref:Uncharacterized protein n=1 Tax=Fusarium sarcochroum TaxID=1208366 RepID=A0A8H4TCM4_9HYPO|nr:hypothetical protein FSARC_11917 [Fusarium sarcochroum]